ncbi:hypothetical protein [Spirosoma litoris]
MMNLTSLLSYFLFLFPFVGLVLLAVTFWLFNIRYREGFVYRKRPFIRYFFIAGLGAILTQWCYVYAPERIFTNAEHHVIEWLGYSFGDQLILVDQQEPDRAIWDAKTGKLQVNYRPATNDFNLRGTNFTEPIFAQTSPEVYTLQNPVINQPIRQQFSIDLDSISLQFQLRFGPDSSSFRVIRKGTTYGPFTVPVKMPLQKGYSVGGLLAKTRADVPGMGDLVAVLDSVYLLRKYVEDKPTPERDSIVLFPSQQLLQQSVRIHIDTKLVVLPASTNPSVTLSAGQFFYLGLWGATNPVYSIRRSAHSSEWLIRFPQREYLKRLSNNGESLFLTSSAQEVTRSQQMAGFYYPFYEQETNVNHVSANLSYRTGSTQQTMQFRLINYDQNNLTSTGLQTAVAGDTIHLATRGLSQGVTGTQWLVKIRNLKATNPLQFWHMLLLTLFIVGSIYVCMLLTPADKQTKAEYIVYMLVLVLMTIRSILLWRASTFLPVEDITPNEYQKLADLGWSSFIIGVRSCLVFFGLIVVWKKWSEPIRWAFGRMMDWLFPQSANKTFSPWLLLGFGVYGLGIAALLVGGKAERFGAIYLPLAAYFFLNFIFLRALVSIGHNTEKDPSYRFLTRLNWLICLGYLGVSDAGFSIIFLVGTLVYNIIRELTFPRKQLPNLNAEWRIRTIRTLQWAFLLVSLIWLSPYALSGLFRYTAVVVYGLAALFLLYGGWSVWRNNSIQLLSFRIPRWVVPAICVVLAIGLVGLKAPITRKVQNKSYVRYRSEVLFTTPDDIIEQEEFRFNLGKDSELLRAAQNQWLIHYFYDKGSINPKHYFRVLPSFKKGSPYLTQICDLVSVRYVIGEHSEFIITFLLSFFIVLLLAAADSDSRFNYFSMIRIKLLCLLFATGLFVWLAATNRIIFLGQDFPLLSLNSILTCVFTFSILFLVIVLGDQANIEPASLRFTSGGQKQANIFFRIGMLLFIFALIYSRKHPFSDERFNLEQTITSLQESFRNLNESFARFQNDQETVEKGLPMSAVVQQFDTSSYAPRHNPMLLGDSRFAGSAYNAYIKLLAQQQNSPDNLIHIRQKADKTYQFAVNELFYNVSSPDVTLNAWRGHLLSDERNETASFTNRQTNESLVMDTKKADADLQHTLGSLFNQEANNNIWLTRLPVGWSLDSLPVVIVSRRAGQQASNRADFVIKSGADVFQSKRSVFAMALHPNDILQFLPNGQSRPATLQYQYQTKQYFAKNVWLNGHQQFFYPLGDKFLWSYHFANLVKSKYDQGKTINQEDVRLSLDPRLTEQIHDLAAKYLKKDKKGEGWGPETERARAFNLVVLGSDGKLRALADFKKGATPKINPNRMSRYQDLFTSLYLNAQTDRERMLFGNRCLMRMDNGPASTFKPILYSAVTSQYRFDWENLKFGGLDKTITPGFLEKNRDDFRIRRFGGGAVRFTVGNDSNMELHPMDTYISKSTNTYNSMMVFLGSLSHDQIAREQQYVKGNGMSTFLALGRSDKANENFPLLNISGKEYHIKSVNVNWGNTESLLGRGLWYNFDLPIQPEHVAGRNATQQNIAADLDTAEFKKSKSSNKVWSFPEASHLYLMDRNNLHNAIVQCATGADPINTTPYKMAEMAAKLFSFNRSFRGSVLADNHQKNKELSVDNTWSGASNLSRFYSQTLFNAMHNSTINGTAKNALGTPDTYPAEFKPYYFYAKTGTISGDRDGGKRDKHLMLIISRDPLHQRNLTPADLKNNRFMVLYFSFYKQSNGAEWDAEVQPTMRDMVRAVINSDSFKSFMHGTQH